MLVVGIYQDFATDDENYIKRHGYLICYGQAISRTTYKELFTIIGTDYGVGDGSSTFNLPDCRGRASIAADNQGGTSANVVTNTEADSIAGKLGEESVTDVPAHTHTMSYQDRVGLIGGANHYVGLDPADGTINTGSTGESSVSIIQPSHICYRCIYTGVMHTQ